MGFCGYCAVVCIAAIWRQCVDSSRLGGRRLTPRRGDDGGASKAWLVGKEARRSPGAWSLMESGDLIVSDSDSRRSGASGGTNSGGRLRRVPELRVSEYFKIDRCIEESYSISISSISIVTYLKSATSIKSFYKYLRNTTAVGTSLPARHPSRSIFSASVRPRLGQARACTLCIGSVGVAFPNLCQCSEKGPSVDFVSGSRSRAETPTVPVRWTGLLGCWAGLGVFTRALVWNAFRMQCTCTCGPVPVSARPLCAQDSSVSLCFPLIVFCISHLTMEMRIRVRMELALARSRCRSSR